MGAETDNNVTIESPADAAKGLDNSPALTAPTTTEVKPVETRAPVETKPETPVEKSSDKTPETFEELSDAFDKVAGNEIASKKVDPHKKVDPAKKDETKIVDDPKKELIEPSKTELQKQSRKQVLDQLGIPVETQSLFQQMSNQAFEHVVNTIKENKTSKAKVDELTTALTEARKGQVNLPPSYAEHPQAFVLHPKFADAYQNFNTVSSEEQHWQQQLISIEKGGKWIDLNVDAKGNIVTTEMEPSVEAKYQVQQYFENARALKARYGSQMQQIQGEFTHKHTELKNFIQQREDQFFPHLKDPEVAGKNKYYTGLMNVLKGRGLESNPLASLTSKMYSYLMEQIEFNKQLQAMSKTNGSAEVVKSTTLPPSEKLDNQGRKAPNNGTLDTVEDLSKAFDKVMRGQPPI